MSSASSRRNVVIIGARCAGATLATYLGRAGVSVLLVDSSPLPSDLVLSTHTLHPGGTALLRELALLGALREVTPAIRVLRIGRGSGTLDLHFSDADAEYCPRRARFDSLLQDCALQRRQRRGRARGAARVPPALDALVLSVPHGRALSRSASSGA